MSARFLLLFHLSVLWIIVFKSSMNFSSLVLFEYLKELSFKAIDYTQSLKNDMFNLIVKNAYVKRS